MSTVLIRSLIQAGVYYGAAQLLSRGNAGKHRVKRTAGAVLMLLLAGFFLSLSGVGFLAALFFQLADLFDLVVPALWTGGVAGLVALALLFQSFHWFRS